MLCFRTYYNDISDKIITVKNSDDNDNLEYL